MNAFCPSCGRTHRYHLEIVGLMPILCPCCTFFLKKRTLFSGNQTKGPRVPYDLRPYGLTFVRN